MKTENYFFEKSEKTGIEQFFVVLSLSEVEYCVSFLHK